MLTAQAFVETDRAGRYLVQVCRHFSKNGRHRSGAAARHGGAAGEPSAAGDVGVEWSQTEGLITFGWGRASLQATATALVLRVEADSADGLRRLQELLAGHLQRFGRRAHLTVAWHPAEMPGAAGRARPQ